jgi:hypothetical protein
VAFLLELDKPKEKNAMKTKMTPEEALFLFNNMEFAEKYQGKDEYTEVTLVIKQALEKQIPKRANEDEYPWAICPICGGSVSLENVIEYLHNQVHSHCEHCGQALDWRDTE